MAAEPVVNRLEEEFAGQLLVLKVDIQSEAGRALGAEFGSRVTPTFILFDGAGVELWRSIGTLDASAVTALLSK